jgi:hypothetical protein
MIREFIIKPATGTYLAVSAGLSFFFLCIVLPLVGPAGAKVDHAGKNRAVFLLTLFVTLALAAAAVYSKMGSRKENGGPLPCFSIALCAICILTFIVLMTGGLAI